MPSGTLLSTYLNPLHFCQSTNSLLCVKGQSTNSLLRVKGMNFSHSDIRLCQLSTSIFGNSLCLAFYKPHLCIISKY